jgi:hypothetical protein
MPGEMTEMIMSESWNGGDKNWARADCQEIPSWRTRNSRDHHRLYEYLSESING